MGRPGAHYALESETGLASPISQMRLLVLGKVSSPAPTHPPDSGLSRVTAPKGLLGLSVKRNH